MLDTIKPDQSGEPEFEKAVDPNAQPFLDKYDHLVIGQSGIDYNDEDRDPVPHIPPPVPTPTYVEITGNHEKIKIRFENADGQVGEINLKEEKFPKPHIERA